MTRSIAIWNRSFATTRLLTGFEAQWRRMGEKERDQIEREYDHFAKGDWRQLTFEQKRART